MCHATVGWYLSGSVRSLALLNTFDRRMADKRVHNSCNNFYYLLQANKLIHTNNNLIPGTCQGRATSSSSSQTLYFSINKLGYSATTEYYGQQARAIPSLTEMKHYIIRIISLSTKFYPVSLASAHGCRLASFSKK